MCRTDLLCVEEIFRVKNMTKERMEMYVETYIDLVRKQIEDGLYGNAIGYLSDLETLLEEFATEERIREEDSK